MRQKLSFCHYHAPFGIPSNTPTCHLLSDGLFLEPGVGVSGGRGTVAALQSAQTQGLARRERSSPQSVDPAGFEEVQSLLHPTTPPKSRNLKLTTSN